MLTQLAMTNGVDIHVLCSEFYLAKGCMQLSAASATQRLTCDCHKRWRFPNLEGLRSASQRTGKEGPWGLRHLP